MISDLSILERGRVVIQYLRNAHGEQLLAPRLWNPEEIIFLIVVAIEYYDQLKTVEQEYKIAESRWADRAAAENDTNEKQRAAEEQKRKDYYGI